MGLGYGISGIAISILGAVILSSVFGMWVLTNKLQISLSVLWRTISVPLISAFVAAFAGWLFKYSIAAQFPPLLKMTVVLAIIATGYFCLIIPRYYKELHELGETIRS